MNELGTEDGQRNTEPAHGAPLHGFLSHLPLSFSPMETRRSARCEHQPTWVGRVAVAACADCGQVDWFSDAGPLDPAEGMAYLFGTYDLVDHLDALAAPAPSVLVYAPPSARKRANLDALPNQ